jgi:hypothetical protein
MKLLVDLGAACSAYQDKAFRNLTCKRIQCDEIWNFVGCKERNVPADEKAKVAAMFGRGRRFAPIPSSFLAGTSATGTAMQPTTSCMTSPDGSPIASR